MGRLAERGAATSIALAVPALLLIAYLDHLSGHEIPLTILYLGPVLFATWRAGRVTGIALSFFSSTLWVAAHRFAGQSFPTPYHVLWAVITGGLLFSACAALLDHIQTLYQRTHDLAHRDALTGVYNRRAFYLLVNQILESARRAHQPLTLIYVDCDEFKAVNDRLGHDAGDQLLREIAKVMQGHVRDADILARLGGDEFAVALPQTDSERAHLVAERLREDLKGLNPLKPGDVPVSLGIATFDRCPESVDTLLNRADALMYAARRRGRGFANYDAPTSK
jgi:diguanylate cyclase (GGDEF)-like protein